MFVMTPFKRHDLPIKSTFEFSERVFAAIVGSSHTEPFEEKMFRLVRQQQNNHVHAMPKYNSK